MWDFWGADPLWLLYKSSYKEPINSSGIAATGIRTNFLLTAEEQGGTDRSWALFYCTQAASLHQPWGERAEGKGASGAPSSCNRGAQGLPVCLHTQVHMATAARVTAHTSGWSTELGMPWTLHYFWLEQKSNASKQTLILLCSPRVSNSALKEVWIALLLIFKQNPRFWIVGGGTLKLSETSEKITTL